MPKTKAILRQQLVELGRQYSPRVWPYPEMKGTTRELLQARCTWMQKALDLKLVDKDLAYELFSAAWNGFLDPSVAQKAGLQ